MSKLLSTTQQTVHSTGHAAAEEYLWLTNRQFIFDTKITHFHPPGRNYPAFKVLSQFSLLICIFPHTFITSQDTSAVGFTVNSKDTVFPNLCLSQQQFNQWDRAVSHNCHYTGQFWLSIHRRDILHFCGITWKKEINKVRLCNKPVSTPAKAYLFSLINRIL
jgi:hypothetical protein